MSKELKDIGYASIAVVDFSFGDKVAIESISITQDSCDLSGAWLIDSTDEEKIHSVLENKLLIFLGEHKSQKDLIPKLRNYEVDLDDFITEARKEVESALTLFQEFSERNKSEYENYMKIKPAERKLLPKVVKKNLIEPTFSTWPEILNLETAEAELTQLKKLSSVSGTPDEMKRVLAASRLIQLLINMWRKDEVERLNREYVTGTDARSTILPFVWLEKLAINVA